MNAPRYVSLALLLAGCQEFGITPDKDDPIEDPPDSDIGFGLCSFDIDPRSVDTLEECGPYEIGGFNPFIEWEAGRNLSCTSLPAVGDVNADGVPDVVGNFYPLAKWFGQLWVMDGKTGATLWKDVNADLGYGSGVSIADLDEDGVVEIIGVRRKGGGLVGLDVPIPGIPKPQYQLTIWDGQGLRVRSSDWFDNSDFDYATGVSISDMDHDGSPELIAGRVIFNADLTVRGKGTKGRGSWSQLATRLNPNAPTEASLSAVADVDLDGTEEVIVGNAKYAPDGTVLWFDRNQDDGMIAVANLDDDPEGEWIAVSGNTIRAVDTDGTVIWGPKVLNGAANILSPAAIANLDGEPYPEIVVAGGSQLVVFNHDGSRLWASGPADPTLCDEEPVSPFTTPRPPPIGGAEIQDCSGATGASIFDFEGDGIQEVVYIDELAMYAFDGATGTVKFFSDRHDSNTMMDYPVIADVDGDGSAEIAVCHNGSPFALSIYGQADGRWAPTRTIWNQHAYSINNVNDDLTIPADPVQAFQDHNSWHAATDVELYAGADIFDLQTEIVETCDAECDLGFFYVAVQPLNKTEAMEIEAGVPITLYAVRGGTLQKLDTQDTTDVIPAGKQGEAIVFRVRTEQVENAEAIRAVIDNRGGTGNGAIAECVESDNSFELRGPFCQ